MKTLTMVWHTYRNRDHLVRRSVELWGEDTALCSCGKRWDFTAAVFRTARQ